MSIKIHNGGMPMARLKKRKDGRVQKQISVVDENGNPVLDKNGKRKRKTVYGYSGPELDERVFNAK